MHIIIYNRYAAAVLTFAQCMQRADPGAFEQAERTTEVERTGHEQQNKTAERTTEGEGEERGDERNVVAAFEQAERTT